MFDKVLVLAHGHQLFFGAPSDCMRFFTKCSRSLRLVSGSLLDHELTAPELEQPKANGSSTVASLESPAQDEMQMALAAEQVEVSSPDQLIDVVAFLDANRAARVSLSFQSFQPSHADAIVAPSGLIPSPSSAHASQLVPNGSDPVHALGGSVSSDVLLDSSPELTHQATKVDELLQASFLTRFRVLLVRNAKATIRNPGNLLARLAVCIFIGTLAGALFYQLPDGQSSLFRRLSASYIQVLVSNLLPFAHVSLFVDGRLFFNRERRCKLYNTLEYYAAAMLIEAVTVALVASSFYIIFYFMAGLNSAFGFGLLAFVLYYVTGDVFIVMLSNILTNIDMTFAVGSGAVAVGMWYAGYMVRMPDFPPVTGWIQHVHWLRYQFQTMALNELMSSSLPCDLPVADCLPPAEAGKLFIEGWGLLSSFDDKWAGLGICAIFPVIFHVISCLSLKFLWRERA